MFIREYDVNANVSLYLRLAVRGAAGGDSVEGGRCPQQVCGVFVMGWYTAHPPLSHDHRTHLTSQETGCVDGLMVPLHSGSVMGESGERMAGEIMASDVMQECGAISLLCSMFPIATRSHWAAGRAIYAR